MTLRSFAFAAMLAASAAVLAASVPAAADTTSARDGAYLTGGAGKCMDCHGAGLRGAPMHMPPGPQFAHRAPSLRGLPMFATDAAAVHFLMTGILPNGRYARIPMPHYAFHHDDAVAIVTYLRALK